jgi:hypothetical protein
MRKCHCGQMYLGCVFGVPESMVKDWPPEFLSPAFNATESNHGLRSSTGNEDPGDAEYRQLMKLAGDDGCKCGIEGCPGHELIGGRLFLENHPLGPIVITVRNQ